MTTHVKPQILTRSSAEQRFEYAFSMESSANFHQRSMMWPVGHAFLVLTCMSQSLSWLQLRMFSDLPAQHSWARHCQKPLCNSKILIQVLQKSSSGSWRKPLLISVAFPDIVFGDCFLSKMLSTWMCRIWAGFPGNSMLKIHALLKMQGFLMILFRLFLHDWHQQDLYH